MIIFKILFWVGLIGFFVIGILACIHFWKAVLIAYAIILMFTVIGGCVAVVTNKSDA